MLTSKIRMFIQVQLVITVSAPSARNRNNGNRLMKKAILMAVFTCRRAHSGGRGVGERVVSRG